MLLTENPPRYKQAFFLALGIAALIFLPFVLYDSGYFIYYGDFNVQQIPFYKLAHEAVRSGDWYWNWYTDLGANFIGSYSFYLLFSPFFWLTLPFPTQWLPFLMAPLLVIKTASASLTAYCYLERFVRDRRYAVIGSLLYAFSGWMAFNIFFNHFHDVAVFFPLLLLGVEKLVTEEKYGFFAAMVAINAMVNYWFFVGEAVFVILYVFVRMSDKNWGMSLRKFIHLAFESVLGVGCVAAVLLPSVFALLGNPRTGTDELLTGWNVWLYWHEQRLPAILQSIFFPPELPARPNFFPDHGAKWASLSAWLPMLGPVCVIAYFMQKKDDWLKKILGLCLVFALIPGLNSLFILLNNSYYARWFYMPILLMALASIRALEDSATDTSFLQRSLKWTGLIVLVFIIQCGLTPHKSEEGEWLFGLASDPQLMWIYAGIGIVCLIMTSIFVLHMRSSKRFCALVTAGIAVVSFAFTTFYIANGKNNYERSRFVINTAIRGRETLSLPEGPFARADAYEATDNLLMFWHLPNIQTFHSIVPTSIMEFYPEVGVKRDVGSRPEADFPALRPLLSVRWLFIDQNQKEQSPMPGYKKVSEHLGFNIYENENYIPMGFAYDYYVTRSQLQDINEGMRSNLMLRALVLEDSSSTRYTDILRPYDVLAPQSFSAIDMKNDAFQRRLKACDTFSFDRKGFSATCRYDSPQLVFFSVPWEKGWSARVNGQPVEIERANIGFMAVRVPAGESTIRFSYRTPGLFEGIGISIVFLLILGCYCLLTRKAPKKEVERKEYNMQQSLLKGEAVTLTWEEYLAFLKQQKERREHLEQVLEEAAQEISPEEEIVENEQTFHFQVPDIPPTNDTENNGEDKLDPPLI